MSESPATGDWPGPDKAVSAESALWPTIPDFEILEEFRDDITAIKRYD